MSEEVQVRGQNWHEPRLLDEEETQAFLAYVEEHRGDPEFSVTSAAKALGLHRADVRLTREQVREFDEDYRNARGYGTEAVMNAMVRLGIVGVDEPIVSAGKILGTKRVYDSKAAIELFKALTPDGKAMLASKLGIEISGPDGGPLVVQRGIGWDQVKELLRSVGKDVEAPEGTAEILSIEEESVES